MSGIYGYSAKNPVPTTEYLQLLSKWNRYYGREAEEQWSEGLQGMGCCQEHLSGNFSGSAPVLRRGTRTAVIDALIYNREELLPLVGKNVSCSDEDLLLDLVLEKGFSVLAQVNGDFAGAIYDTAAGSWTLFRDHSGVRPLYYYADGDLFAFSTDLRSLAALPGTDLAINEEKLYLRMMGYNDLTLCETEYANIRCLHPAAWTVVTPTGEGFRMREQRYFTWRQKKIHFKTDREYQQELRRLITDAISRRLEACPGLVGCELSGGLDSSVVAILINRLGREGKFYSWSFSTDEIPMKERDERKIIEDICRQENIQCSYATLDLTTSIDDLFQRVDPPFLNTRSISKGSQTMARQGARIIFTGHGGDEGVSHRCNLYELWYHREYFAFFRNIYRGTRGKKLRLLRTFKRVGHQIFVQNPYFRNPFHNTFNNASRILNPQFVQRLKHKTKALSLPFAYNPKEYILQGGHRVRLDNVALQGAECGVRYMIPFVDYRVLDFALSIPRAQFHNGYTGRYIYRAAFDDIIPQSLRDMHYKDTPSQENYMPQMDMYKQFQETKAQLLNLLDREFWMPYLDFEALERIELPLAYTRADYLRASSLLNEATQCAAIHHVIKYAALWSEDFE